MINNNAKAESTLGVTLSACALRENTYVAHVPRNTVSMDALLNEVVEHNQGIDKYQIGHAAELLKREILNQIKQGKAVNMLDLGTLYIAPTSGVSSLNPSSEDIKNFEARFSSGEELKSVLSTITASVAEIKDSSPVIKTVTNPLDGSTDGNLTATYSVRLSGKKLKVGGTGSGVWFVPVTDDGTADADESKWLGVEEKFITVNQPKTLEFYIPRTVENDTKYKIVIRTALDASGKEKKTLCQGETPNVVTVMEEV